MKLIKNWKKGILEMKLHREDIWMILESIFFIITFTAGMFFLMLAHYVSE